MARLNKYGVDESAIKRMRSNMEEVFNRDGGVRVGISAQGEGDGVVSQTGTLYWSVHCILEALLEYNERMPHVVPDLDNLTPRIVEVYPETENALEGAAGYLIEAGYMESLTNNFGDQPEALRITSRGRTWITELHERRGRPSVRRAIAQRNILRWLADDPGQPITHLPATHRHVDGSEFSTAEITEATGSLVSMGLAEDSGEGAVLTKAGQRCVDSYGGNVAPYQESQQKQRSTYTNIFHGSIGQQQIAQGDYAKMSQDNRNQIAHEVEGLVQNTREALPQIGLDRDDQTELERVLKKLESELSKDEEQNPERLKGTLQWGRDVLREVSIKAASNPALLPFLVAGWERVISLF